MPNERETDSHCSVDGWSPGQPSPPDTVRKFSSTMSPVQSTRRIFSRSTLYRIQRVITSSSGWL